MFEKLPQNHKNYKPINIYLDWVNEKQNKNIFDLGKYRHQNKSYGFVYIIETDKYIKIGVTTEGIKTRLKSLQTGCPTKIKIIYQTCLIPHYKRVEKVLHKKLFLLKTHGEWFHSCCLDVALQTIKKYEQFAVENGYFTDNDFQNNNKGVA